MIASLEPLSDAGVPIGSIEPVGIDGRRGSASAEIARDGGLSYVARCRASSPLRLLTPRGGGEAAWIVASSFGGGLVDGDDLALAVRVGERASCLVTSQSSTKIYRGASSQKTECVVADGATLFLLPDPAVPFAGATYRQSTTVQMQRTSSLMILDVLTAGRVARGERWAADRLTSALTIDVDGRPLLRDTLLLDPAHGPLAARLGRFDAVATLVLLGPRFQTAAETIGAEIRATKVTRGADLVVAGSPIDGGLFVRIAATTIALVLAQSRAWLAPACDAAGEDPWSRRW